jgi:hypothetical protein
MESYRAENPLRKAARRLQEVEERIAELRKLIEHTRAIGHDPASLERLLRIFSQSRDLALQRLALEKEIAGSPREAGSARLRRSPGRRSDDRSA